MAVSPSTSPAPALPWPTIALTAAALLVLAPPLIQAVTPLSPVQYFDVDPRSDVGRIVPTTIGPAAIAWLHVLTVVASAGAMAVAVALGGAIRWSWVALAAVGVAVALLHLEGPIDQWMQIGAWVSAACLGVAAAHLAQHELPRRWMAAALVALLVPLTLQALMYVFVEHPMTVEHYEATRADLLASRGWAPGSSQAEIYERRLTDPAAVGAYGLSNVFGSVVAGLTLLAAGIACFAWRRAGEPPRQAMAWLPAGAALLGVVTLLLTRSKGVAAAACAGAGLLALVWLVRRLRLPRWLPPVAAVSLIAAGVLGVVVRGWMGAPETWEGERSLYFRWQYWGAAARILADALPIGGLLGVGPEGFHVGYERFKDPLSPEVITSTHSVFIDWVTMLGVGGLAWSALLVLWIVQRGRAPEEEAADAVLAQDPPRPLIAAAALGAVVFGTLYAVRVGQMWVDSVLVWLASLVGFVATMVLLIDFLRHRPKAIAPAAFVAAAVLLVHAQIEMTFFQVPSLPLVWLMVGLAGGSAAAARIARPGEPGEPRILPAAVAAAALGAIAIVLVGGYAVPMARVQSRIESAAIALQRGQVMQALDDLDAAGRLAPADGRLLRWRIQLRQEWAIEAARAGRRDQVQQALGTGLIVLDETDAVRGALPDRLRSNLHMLAAETLDDPRHLDLAAAARAAALEVGPYSLTDQITLADLYHRLGRADEARTAYRRALELSEQKYLDPAEQLTPEQRASIEAKIEGEATP